MYFASNKDGFNKALSPKAIKQEIGMATSTYHDQFHYLCDKGYLVDRGNNRFDFYETPQKKNEEAASQIADTKKANSDGGYDWEGDLYADFGIRKKSHADSQEDIEIDNINENTDNEWINKGADFFVKKEKDNPYTKDGFVF